MAPSLTHPRVSRSGNPQNTQLIHELPHRIYTAKVYPLLAPNGSTILLYGHENGVKIVWRGGRAFKPPKTVPAPPTKANGNKNAVISLDSDDDEPKPAPFVDVAEFVDEEDELDSTRPYPKILQTLDLLFGTEVLHLAVLPNLVSTDGDEASTAIHSLKQSIVFIVACADSSIRYITLPIVPPTPRSKDREIFRHDFAAASAGTGKWGEKIVVLVGHKSASDGVAVSVDFAGKARKVSSEPQIIVASHSKKEVTGLLLLWRVSLTSPQPHLEPFQSIHLPSPAISLSFNPTLTGSLSSQLLVADAVGACRIYDYNVVSNASQDLPVDDQSDGQGSWLISLYSGFEKSDIERGADPGLGRKTIVDAKWVYRGRAIIVLLNDGEWSVWDLEGVGPTATHNKFLGQQGIKGGSKPGFSLTGWVEGAQRTATSKNSGLPPSASSKFAPMTPGTRKMTVPFTTHPNSPAGPICGQISVIEVPSSSPATPYEESILFWLNESYSLLPSLSQYWAQHPSCKSTKTSSSNMFNVPIGGRILQLKNVDLQGERCSGIDQFPRESSFGAHNSTFPIDILVLAEHRFIVLHSSKAARVPERLPERPSTDLVKGVLNVMAIDRELDMMQRKSITANDRYPS